MISMTPKNLILIGLIGVLFLVLARAGRYSGPRKTNVLLPGNLRKHYV